MQGHTDIKQLCADECSNDRWSNTRVYGGSLCMWMTAGTDITVNGDECMHKRNSTTTTDMRVVMNEGMS